jgi:two-component system sensor histidine kinase EvgS
VSDRHPTADPAAPESTEARWTALPDEVFEIDAEERVVFANHALPNVPLERLIGTALSGALPVEHRRQVREACRLVRDTDTVHTFEVGGSTSRWWLYRVSPLPEGGTRPDHLLVTRSEITALKAGNTALARDAERYRLMFDSAKMGMALTSVDGTFLMVNRALCSLLGYTESELLASDIYAVTHPDDLAESATQARRLLTGKADTVVVDKRYFHSDGDIVWCRVCATATKDEAGATQYFVTQVQDISGWRQDQGDRLRHERQAFEAGRLRSLQDLAGHVVDELDPLLQSAVSELASLQETLGDEQGVQARLDAVRGAVANRTTFIDQLRTLSRRRPLVRSGITMNLLVTAAAERNRPLLGERCSIRLSLAESLPGVSGDAGQIESAIDALIVNAIEATTDEGDVILETQHLQLDEVYCREHPGLKPGSYIQITVSDSGSGISQDVKPRILDPFFTTKSRASHRGLGLPMALAIAQKHGGTVAAYSESGSGTSARILLPADESGTTLGTGLKARSGETILVAEDEESVSSVTRRVLERLGYRVLTAVDGVEALHMYIAARHQIDLVLLDMAMPRMGGPEAYERIRAIDRTVPIGFMTGYSAELALAALSHSTAVLVTKPFSVDELGRTVRSMLDDAATLDGTPPDTH